jgi:hypothetical protein
LTIRRPESYIASMSPEARRNRNNQISIDHAFT